MVSPSASVVQPQKIAFPCVTTTTMISFSDCAFCIFPPLLVVKFSNRRKSRPSAGLFSAALLPVQAHPQAACVERADCPGGSQPYQETPSSASLCAHHKSNHCSSSSRAVGSFSALSVHSSGGSPKISSCCLRGRLS